MYLQIIQINECINIINDMNEKVKKSFVCMITFVWMNIRRWGRLCTITKDFGIYGKMQT